MFTPKDLVELTGIIVCPLGRRFISIAGDMCGRGSLGQRFVARSAGSSVNWRVNRCDMKRVPSTRLKSRVLVRHGLGHFRRLRKALGG